MNPKTRAVVAWLNAWRQQPTTVGGLATLVAAAGAWCEGDRATAVWLGAGGLVACILPDDSRLRGPMVRLLVDTVSACATRQVVAALPRLAADAVAVAVADVRPADPAPETKP